MSKLFKENGFLSEDGEKIFKETLDPQISALLKQGQNENEIRLIASLIHKRVGDAAANLIQAKKEIANKFAQMSNEQFEGYLKAKYGDRWLFVSLTPEELDRVPRLTKEEISAALEEGRKAREEAERATPMVRINKNLRFR